MNLAQRKGRAVWLLRKVKIKPEIKFTQNRYIFELVDTSSSNDDRIRISTAALVN